MHGHGLVFNVGERVQAYTHPLWFFVLSLSYLLIGNIFFSTFFISILVSIIAAYFLVRKLAVDHYSAIIVMLLAIFS